MVVGGVEALGRRLRRGEERKNRFVEAMSEYFQENLFYRNQFAYQLNCSPAQVLNHLSLDTSGEKCS